MDIVLEKIFVEDDADDLVESFSVDGDAAIPLGGKEFCCFSDGGFRGKAKNIDAGDHDLFDDPLLKINKRADEFLVAGVEVLLELRFADHFAEFGFIGEKFGFERDPFEQSSSEFEEEKGEWGKTKEVERSDGGKQLEDGAAPEIREEADEEIEDERGSDDDRGDRNERGPILGRWRV